MRQQSSSCSVLGLLRTWRKGALGVKLIQTQAVGRGMSSSRAPELVHVEIAKDAPTVSAEISGHRARAAMGMSTGTSRLSRGLCLEVTGFSPVRASEYVCLLGVFTHPEVR